MANCGAGTATGDDQEISSPKRIEGHIMKLPRRRFLHLAAGAAVLPTVSRVARAQTYPARPVRLVVPFAPGGLTDILARLTGQWLSERLGQPFLVENRPGAGTNIATEAVARAPPDGNTLLLASTANSINATLYEKLDFNFLRDFAPVAGLMRVPNVMEVNPSIAAKTVPEFIAYAKANPGRINMGSGGIGASPHMSGELFKAMAGVSMIHVPYRGMAPALTDLLAGQVDVVFDNITTSIEHIRAGRIRALAVTTATRSDLLPDIPTVAEYLPGYEASGWFGVSAPKNTPADIVERLNNEINAGIADPKMKARFAEFGGTALAGSPADFGKLIVDETEKWAKVVKFAGIKA
jgi:tripartite-type tricarboxylate transporter receptor subunit TctC